MLFLNELMAKTLHIRVNYQTIFGITVMTIPMQTEERTPFATIRLQWMIILNRLFLITRPVLDLFVSVPPRLVVV